jgi:cobalt-zinc-cadmium efflux system outer membrane protein
MQQGRPSAHLTRLPAGLLLALLAGCTVVPEQPAGAPLGGELPAYEAPVTGIRGVRPDLEVPSELQLQQALALALLHGPELQEASWEQRAAEAAVLQAGLLPNPELEVEVEEFAGEGPRHGFEAAEFTLALAQELELPGKRRRRLQGAQLEAQLAAWDREVRRLDVLTATRRAWLQVLAVQARLELAREMVQLTERQASAVTARAEAGKVPPLEAQKARVALARARLALHRVEQEHEAGRYELASTWGADQATFTRVTGRLEGRRSVPPLARLRQRLEQNPDLARWAVALELRETAVAAEDLAWLPDLEAVGGFSHFNEDDGDALLAGVGLQLPVFDRNQGGRRAARAELEAARAAHRAARIETSAALVAAHGRLGVAAGEAAALETEVLPAAERAFAAAQRGYEQGKFGYLEVLDAQRTLFEVREQLIEASAAYRLAVADCERLIGQGLDHLDEE